MEEQKSTAGKGLGIAGLIIGIIALLVSFIPFFGMLSIYIGGLALLLSIIGLILAVSKKASKGLIIAALIISALATGIAAWQISKITEIATEV
ncbi:MAG: hypothetical protein HC831_09775 [Chloroflexia bacterium]|nr:hypothetical protein [Chloroflexia bacterium]